MVFRANVTAKAPKRDFLCDREVQSAANSRETNLLAFERAVRCSQKKHLNFPDAQVLVSRDRRDATSEIPSRECADPPENMPTVSMVRGKRADRINPIHECNCAMCSLSLRHLNPLLSQAEPFASRVIYLDVQKLRPQSGQ